MFCSWAFGLSVWHNVYYIDTLKPLCHVPHIVVYNYVKWINNIREKKEKERDNIIYIIHNENKWYVQKWDILTNAP